MEPKFPFRELDNYYWDTDNKSSDAMTRWIHTFVTWSNAYLAGAGDPQEVPRGMSCNIASLYLQGKDTSKYTSQRSLVLLFRYVLLVHYPTLLSNEKDFLRGNEDVIKEWGAANTKLISQLFNPHDIPLFKNFFN